MSDWPSNHMIFVYKSVTSIKMDQWIV